MPHAEEHVDWKQELQSLPAPIRGAILALRLLGLIGVILILVSVNMARELGLLEDQATKDRRTILQSSVEQTRLLRESQTTLNRTLEVIEKHSSNTEQISRTQCMLIPNITDKERRACVNGEKW